MNQKTGKSCFLCFRLKSKTRDLVDWDKTKTRDKTKTWDKKKSVKQIISEKKSVKQNTFSLFSLTSFSRKWFYKTDFLILYFQPNSSTKHIF